MAHLANIICPVPRLRPSRIARVVALIALAFTPMFSSAQADRGAITGTITDPSGAVIPGVQVTATNPATGATFTSVSNNSGIYNLLNLPVATYSVHYARPEFKALDRNGVAIQVQQRAQIDVKLEVGSQDQTITVTAAPALQTQTELGTNLTSQVVTDLPLTANGGRDITSFAFSITPTVTGGEYTSHIGGSQAFGKQVLIDGTSSDSGSVGHIGESEPSMDAISQFQVDTSGIGPEAGRTGGGTFLFSLKSGTNSVHGSAFGFLANEFLNANTWDNNYFRSYYDAQNPATTAANAQQYRTPKSRYFDYGGSAGGPLWRNRMFIFGAVERFTRSDFSVANGQQTVPTTAFLMGDFSSLLQTGKPPLGIDPAGNPIYPGAIYDPGLPGSVPTGKVFPGNIIPQGRISPISQKIVALYAQDYQPTFSDRTIGNYPALRNGFPDQRQTQLSFKYDFDVTTKNRLSASYIYTLAPRTNRDLGANGNALWQAGSQNGGPLAPGGVQTTISNAYRFSDTYTVTPNLLNVFSLTFNQFQNKALPVTGTTSWPGQIGLGDYQTVPNFPLITFGATVNGVREGQIGNAYTPNSGYVAYNEILNDTLTWVRGIHNIKLGLELRGLGVNSDYNGGELRLNFSNLSGAPAKSSIQSVTGFGFANFLLGDVYNASKDTPFNQYGRRKEYAFFGEDTVKVTQKLTLDAALRWDIPLQEHEKYGHWSNFTTDAKNPNFGPYFGSMQYLTSPDQTFETYRNFWQFSPHIGAAYQLNDKVVLRSSYGLYYVPIGNNSYGAVPYSSSTGYQATNQVLPPKLSNSYQFNWNNGYPGKDVYPTRDNNSPYVPYGPASVDPNSLTMGYTQNWNVNAQYEFAKNTVLQLSYIGNIGRKLHDGALNPYNFPTWQRYSQLYNSGHVFDYVYDSSSATAAGVPYPYAGWGGASYQAINPFPQVANTYGPVFFVNSPLGASSYEAFVVEVTRRSSNGLSMDLSYTGSATRGNTDTAFVDTYSASHYFQDPYQYKKYASDLIYYDVPHEVKGYVNYELPFGHGRRYLSGSRWQNLLAGGWLVGAIVDYHSGSPIGAVGSQNYYPGWSGVWTDVAPNASFKNTFQKVDLIHPDNPSSLFVNPANFTNPADGQLGNSPHVFDGWHTFAYYNEDASLLKRFGFGADDRFRVTLRAEFFNVLNRHHWANPDLSLGSQYFGHVTDTQGDPRRGQLGARFEW
jgi:hypothetical protein